MLKQNPPITEVAVTMETMKPFKTCLNICTFLLYFIHTNNDCHSLVLLRTEVTKSGENAQETSSPAPPTTTFHLKLIESGLLTKEGKNGHTKYFRRE